jgi:hypothetical protein
MGHAVLNPGLAYVRLNWPTHPKIGQAKRPVVNSLTPLFVCVMI